jgi:cytochrome c-type biogenesis protein CcsB
MANLLNFEELENFLRNATFLILFFTTLLYWSSTAFSSASSANSSVISKDMFATLVQSSIENLQSSSQNTLVVNKTNNEVFSKQKLNMTLPTVVPKITMFLSNFLLVILLVVRWETAGHFPLSNLYESLMFLSWCCTFLYLISEQFLSTSSINAVNKILGSITASSALLMNAFATFSLPKEMQQASPLVPALQSNWLMMHVTVMIISYATLIIGSLLSIFLLILLNFQNSNVLNDLSRLKMFDRGREAEQNKTEGNTNSGKGMGGSLANSSVESSYLVQSSMQHLSPDKKSSEARWSGLKIINYLDLLSYRIIGLGFPFLTIGILSGAVWANEAWGSYWSWDPKETWALLTWLVFAIYLHTRLTKGWEGKQPAIIASVGFLVVWFCYLGVNLIGEGLHSYGFF